MEPLRNSVHPANAGQFLKVTGSSWLQNSCFLKSKVDNTLEGGRSFFPVNLKNADLDLNHLQMQHNSFVIPLPAGSLLNL